MPKYQNVQLQYRSGGNTLQDYEAYVCVDNAHRRGLCLVLCGGLSLRFLNSAGGRCNFVSTLGFRSRVFSLSL